MPSSTSSPSNNLRCLRFLLSSMVGCNTKQMSTFIFHQILECSQAHPQTFHVTQRPNCGTKHLPYSNQIQQPKHGPKQHQRSNRAAKSTQNWTQRSNHGTSNQNSTMATHTSLIRIKNPRYQAPPVWEIRTPKSYCCPGKNYQARSTRSSTCREGENHAKHKLPTTSSISPLTRRDLLCSPPSLWKPDGAQGSRGRSKSNNNCLMSHTHAASNGHMSIRMRTGMAQSKVDPSGNLF